MGQRAVRGGTWLIGLPGLEGHVTPNIRVPMQSLSFYDLICAVSDVHKVSISDGDDGTPQSLPRQLSAPKGRGLLSMAWHIIPIILQSSFNFHRRGAVSAWLCSGS